jgi:hypothetical protein
MHANKKSICYKIIIAIIDPKVNRVNDKYKQVYANNYPLALISFFFRLFHNYLIKLLTPTQVEKPIIKTMALLKSHTHLRKMIAKNIQAVTCSAIKIASNIPPSGAIAQIIV